MVNPDLPVQKKKLTLEYRQGDLFDGADESTLLVHSCNCRGTWGKGIARQFKHRYPTAFEFYHVTCITLMAEVLLGHSVLIYPDTVKGSGENESTRQDHPIGSLLVRDGWGKIDPGAMPDYVDETLRYTRDAVCHLLDTLADLVKHGKIAPDSIKEIRMPKINSGYFQVPWHLTEALLLDIDAPEECPAFAKIVVYYRFEQD